MVFGLTLEEKFRELSKQRKALLSTPPQWWNRNTYQRELHKVNVDIDKVLDERLAKRKR